MLVVERRLVFRLCTGGQSDAGVVETTSVVVLVNAPEFFIEFTVPTFCPHLVVLDRSPEVDPHLPCVLSSVEDVRQLEQKPDDERRADAYRNADEDLLTHF